METKNFTLNEFLCHCCGEGADIIKPELIQKLQHIRDDYGKPLYISSGYRCFSYNKWIGGRPNSAHLSGEAADIADPDGAIKAWMNEDMLAIYGIWAEAYNETIGWTHWQIRPAVNRIFLP